MGQEPRRLNPSTPLIFQDAKGAQRPLHNVEVLQADMVARQRICFIECPTVPQNCMRIGKGVQTV
jgi:hypothetical protein